MHLAFFNIFFPRSCNLLVRRVCLLASPGSLPVIHFLQSKFLVSCSVSSSQQNSLSTFLLHHPLTYDVQSTSTLHIQSSFHLHYSFAAELLSLHIITSHVIWLPSHSQLRRETTTLIFSPQSHLLPSGKKRVIASNIPLLWSFKLGLQLFILKCFPTCWTNYHTLFTL